MIIDIAIVLFAISALYRGQEIGFIRQILATVGFFGGLFIGAAIQPHILHFVHAQLDRVIVAVATSLAFALGLLTLGEYIGIRLKKRFVFKPINHIDVVFGAIINVIATVFALWLMAALIGTLPLNSVNQQIKSSRIIRQVNHILPPAPTLISRLGKLIDPNGFPQVFVGHEPAPAGKIDLPALGDIAPAVEKDRNSVVQVEGYGCGGLVEGSGFVVAPGVIATNAHVIAGIKQPYVADIFASHKATPIWFDPKLDFALLKVSGINDKPLKLSTSVADNGTPAAVLGYPGGGAFSAKPAAVIDTILATGRNIYGEGISVREVYEVKASVVPGNSGGPLVASDGSVIGVVFAQSTSYQNVGYALTSARLAPIIAQAQQHGPVSTGQCAE